VITQARLKKVLDYNPRTGVFIWKSFPVKGTGWNKKLAGKVAGHIVKLKEPKSSVVYHRLIMVDRVKYKVHKLAWLYVYGKRPKHLEHINGNSLDNRIKNLQNIIYAKKKITDILRYEPKTGEFFWIKPRLKSNLIGKVAGTTTIYGYRQVKIFQKKYLLHRLAWELTYGPIQKGLTIDHINRVRTDNRLSNLRLATLSQNSANCVKTTAKSGHRFISPQYNDYGYRIRVKGTEHYAKTIEEAILIRNKVLKQIYGKFVPPELLYAP
jgi:Drexlerviridae HNH endonuclease